VKNEIDRPIPLVDLQAQHRPLRGELEAAIGRVIDGSAFILGEEVRAFEEAFASAVGADSAVGVGSGFDALRLSLLALGVGPGDEVVTPANTFSATALAVRGVGGRPVLADCDPVTRTLDPASFEEACTSRTRAVVPVHLYGKPADVHAIVKIARERGIAVVEDVAQAAGAFLDATTRAGALGEAGCFSFYPSKNLGGLGDGGMVVTSEPALAERLRTLRDYGRSGPEDHLPGGVNSRLDGIQAACLGVKLPHLDAWNRLRREAACRYRARLEGLPLGLPADDAQGVHVYHLFVVETPRRDALREHLASMGIATGIHYAKPIHFQSAFAALGYKRGAFPHAERLSDEVLSLPVFPELEQRDLDRVTEGVRGFFTE
jgi:dTDP-4-amino-4,6-dideoxygalactose transaminase